MLNTGLGRFRPLIGTLGALALVAVVSCAAPKTETKPLSTEGVKVTVGVSKPQWKTELGVLSINGEIHAKDVVQVLSETQGKVLKVRVDVGSPVAPGDVLVEVEDDVRLANLESAQASFDKTKADWDRAQQLFAQNVISETDRQGIHLTFVNAQAQLVSARRDYENTKIRAPIGGLVTERSVSVGTMVTPGTAVARVIDITRLKLQVPIGENDVLRIKKGQAVAIEANQYPGQPFSGTVFAISPESSSARTFPVEIDLKNDPGKPLYDGMLGTAKIDLGKRSVFTIPRVAVVGSVQKPQVFVIQNGTAHLKDLVVGSEFGTDIEVVNGLGETEQVVTSGQNNLDEGSEVTIVPGASL